MYLSGCSPLVSGCSGCSGFCDFCLSCDACSCRCVPRGRICVSEWRCSMFVSCVHPVASLRHVFCMVCSLLVFVSDMMGDQMVLAYSITGRVIVL